MMPRFLLFLLLALLAAPAVYSDSLWQPLPDRERAARGLEPGAGTAWRLQELSMRDRLLQADTQGHGEITLPVDGKLLRFEVTPSPIMAPALAARYPQIRSYRIRGIDDPAASGRLSISHRGFGAAFDAGGETRYIDPDRQQPDIYRVQGRRQLKPRQIFVCGVHRIGQSSATPAQSSALRWRTAARSPGKLRLYRIAIATTVEYSNAVKQATSSTDSEIRQDVLAEINRLLNRVNEIYERDLAVRLQLVNDNDQLISVGDPAQDPFTNDDGATMIDENQAFIDRVIGKSNYDLGHVLSTGGGGIANVDSICNDSVKAGGVTGLADPLGDAFYIDYVAHEIGHQFGLDHSFNGTSSGCNGNRAPAQAFEPGSGSTIMSYAGICSPENTSLHALAMFHGGSIEVVDQDTSSGWASHCGTLVTANDPNQPVVNAGLDKAIPKRTPFRLTATASDADGDALSYAWEEMDTGTATNRATFGKDLGDNPLFRSFEPSSTPSRDFPALGLTLLGKYDKAEVMPCQDRELNFRVTVRDGKGGLARDDLQLTVDGDAGPFRITSQQTAETLYPVNPLLLSWDTAGTNHAPVDCPSVDISLLSFNGSSNEYGETRLRSNEPNDGQALLRLPDRFAGRARLRVACSNNYFYAVSPADLRIEGNANDPFPVSGSTAFYSPDASLTMRNQSVDGGCVPDARDSGGTASGGSGSLPPVLLFGLAGLWALRQLRVRVDNAS